MSKLTESQKKISENDTVVGRLVLLVNAVVDDLDALAMAVSDPAAREKIFALADEYEGNKKAIVSSMLVGTPARPEAEPAKLLVHTVPEVSKESADATSDGAIHANTRKRVERKPVDRNGGQPDRNGGHPDDRNGGPAALQPNADRRTAPPLPGSGALGTDAAVRDDRRLKADQPVTD